MSKLICCIINASCTAINVGMYVAYNTPISLAAAVFCGAMFLFVLLLPN